MTATHANEPIEKNKELSGNSRKGGDAPPEIQQKIIDIIIEEARTLQFNNRDIAYYIAIAKRESGFNPDAANGGSTASGIAQVTDKTAATYGINDGNRFNARASIQAGLGYFADIKKKIVRDYGTAENDAEPMIYFLYHYGIYFHYNDRVHAKDPKPLSELKLENKYADSKTVVDEAARIEKVLNDAHGLKVQLTDITGQPMSGRKVIVVQKKAITQNENASPSNPSAESVSAKADAPSDSSAGGTSDYVLKPALGWELTAYETVTDDEGHIKEIITEMQEPLLILVPRIEYEAYNEAIMSQSMCPAGNQHTIETRDGEQGALATISTQETPLEIKAPKPKAATVERKPAGFASAAEHDAKARANPPPVPSAAPTLTFTDAVIAIQKYLGWEIVDETAFSYIKQFFTRPKLPATPLDETTPTKKSEARTQVISSSLKNSETKSLKTKDTVMTAKETAVKEVKVEGDATWMTYAIQEQSKKDSEKVEKKANTQLSDKEWQSEHKKYVEADASIKNAKKEMHTQNQLPEKKKDSAKIKNLEDEIKVQQSIKSDAASKMEVIEKEYNNQDIIKYLKSAKIDTSPGGIGTFDETAWCASYVNWCLEQAGYVGPASGPASAENWKNWGKELTEPKYGAITVVTRGVNLYHVGFFTNIVPKSEKDGFEEIEQKNKKGEIVKVKKPKFKKANYVQLLSGNMTSKIRELAEWSEAPTKTLHLVSYRWPTDNEKKK